MVPLTVLAGLAIVLCLLNLALVAAIIRRVTDHQRSLDYLLRQKLGQGMMFAPGERVQPFETVTVDGHSLSRDDLRAGTLVGFFDPECESCHERLPGFLVAAREVAGGREQTLAVVGQGPGTDQVVGLLRDTARVVSESRQGPLQRAFGVSGYPAFCRLGDGQVIAAHEFGAAMAAT